MVAAVNKCLACGLCLRTVEQETYKDRVCVLGLVAYWRSVLMSGGLSSQITWNTVLR